MKGFFNVVKKKLPTCTSCGLYKYAKSPHMMAHGNFKKKILNIGEYPSILDDINNNQWQDEVGDFLNHIYNELNIDLFDDCLNINAINCVSIDNSTNKAKPPINNQITCCRSYVHQVIKENNPKIILAFGKAALISLIGHKWKKNLNDIENWRGFAIPDHELNAWICPVYSPSYILNTPNKEIITIWKHDLLNAFSLINKELPNYKNPNQCIHFTDDLPSFPNMVSIDYKTIGLQPYSKNHKIICISVAYNENEAYSFILPTKLSTSKKFINMLENKNIRKIAHNMKFEDTWSVVKSKRYIQNWCWDTMLASHIIDNRPNITDLKFQIYINFGIIFDDSISSYLENEDIDSLNYIFKSYTGRRKLLTYSALDSLFTYRLAIKQMQEIGYDNTYY